MMSNYHEWIKLNAVELAAIKSLLVECVFISMIQWKSLIDLIKSNNIQYKL